MKKEKNRYIIILTILSSLTVILFLVYDRAFYSDYTGEKYITVWKQLDDETIIVKGKYYGVLPPKDNYIKIYKSKNFYICWNDESYDLVFNLGSKVIDKKGFDNCRFLDHNTFFDNYQGIIYSTEGKLKVTNPKIYKHNKYQIDYID